MKTYTWSEVLSNQNLDFSKMKIRAISPRKRTEWVAVPEIQQACGASMWHDFNVKVKKYEHWDDTYIVDHTHVVGTLMLNLRWDGLTYDGNDDILDNEYNYNVVRACVRSYVLNNFNKFYCRDGEPRAHWDKNAAADCWNLIKDNVTYRINILANVNV